MTKKGSWQPFPSDRVCSIHFVDGLAADENTIPTLFLGYESKEKKSRRTLFGKSLEKNVTGGDITPATSTSEGIFIDGNLAMDFEELNEPMKVMHERVKDQ